MKKVFAKLLVVSIFSVFYVNLFSQAVGINTTPHNSSVLDIASTTKGVLIPRMNSATRLLITDPANGLLVFDTQTNSFWYYKSSAWTELKPGVFENASGVVRNSGNNVSDDFVFGNAALPPAGAITDNLFFFDKSKGAFRAGRLFNSNDWSETNRGDYSFGAGYNTRASGNGSIALGVSALATGTQSIAIGTSVSASAAFAFAAGTLNYATGENSAAFGNNIRTRSLLSFGLGRHNVGNFSSINSWVPTDPIFEIGIGTLAQPDNALTVLKDGTFFIKRADLIPSTPITDTFVMYDPHKSAFRGGDLNNTASWKAANLGKSSFAYGRNVLASGWYSAALGDSTSALGFGSFAFGNKSLSFGDYSVAGGYLTSALGDGSVAIGYLNTADQLGSVAMGTFTTAHLNGTAFGSRTQALGLFSTAMGYYARSVSYGSTAIGLYNVGFGSSLTLPEPEDPILEVGMGFSETQRENAMTILKSGHVVLGPHEVPENGINYSGSMFYYNRAKSSLRVGLAQSQKWAPDSLGVLSIAIGNGTLGYGYASAAFGNYSRAVGSFSFAAGSNAVAKANTSIALGYYAQAGSLYGIAVGTYNIGQGTLGNWIATDPIFEVGNGQSAAAKSNALTVLKNGYVGIGTSSPTTLLQLKKNSNTTNPQLEIIEEGADFARITMKNDQDASYWTLASRPNADSTLSRFNIFNSQKGDVLSLQGDGDAIISERLAVGTLTPLAALTANSVAGSDALRVQVGGTTKMRVYENGSISLGGHYGDPAPNGSPNDVFVVTQMGFGVASPIYRLEIENNATPSVGQARATGWVTYSDARVKKNVKNIPYGLKEVLALNPVSYRHQSSTFENGQLIIKDDYAAEIGFIAQDVHKIIAEIVDKPDNELVNLWCMNYEKLTPVLVKAIQEQQVEIERQRLEISNLNQLVLNKDNDFKNVISSLVKRIETLETVK